MEIINMWTAIMAGTFFALLMQVLRQVTPNFVTYLWQEHLATVLVPLKYRDFEWFEDKNSFFYINKNKFSFKIFSIFNQGNARTLVLHFSIIFWLFSTQPMQDIVDAKLILLSTLITSSTAIAMGIFAWRLAKRNTNPDIFIKVSLQCLSIAISFSTTLLLIKSF